MTKHKESYKFCFSLEFTAKCKNHNFTGDYAAFNRLIFEPRQEKTCFMLYAKNKDPYQPAHLHSLISVLLFTAYIVQYIQLLKPKSESDFIVQNKKGFLYE